MPAHAQRSPTAILLPTTTEETLPNSFVNPNIGGPAGQSSRSFALEAILNDPDEYRVNIASPDREALHSGILNIDGSASILATDPTCTNNIARSFNAWIISISQTQLEVQIDARRGGTLEFPLPVGEPLGLRSDNCLETVKGG